MTQVLSRIQKQYGPKGVQFIAACFDDGVAPKLPAFLQQFQPPFPVGWAERERVHAWLGFSIMRPVYVPILAFIDAKGTVRYQFTGDDSAYLSNAEVNIAGTLDSLLKGPAPAAAAKPVAKTAAKK